MGAIIARFADGRLLVQEDTTVAQDYLSGGVKMRIGNVKTVEKVLSLDAHMSGYPGMAGRVETPLREVLTSGDTVLVPMYRCDLGLPTFTGVVSGIVKSGLILSGDWGLSGLILSGSITVAGPIGSGTAGFGILSAITSGLGYMAELSSGRPVSGIMKVLANIIGF